MACVITCLSVLYEKYVDNEIAAKAISNNSLSNGSQQVLSNLSISVDNRPLAQLDVSPVLPRLRSAKMGTISSETLEIIINSHSDNQMETTLEKTLILSTTSKSSLIAVEKLNLENSSKVQEETSNVSQSSLKPIVVEKNISAYSIDSAAVVFKNRYPEQMFNLIQKDANSSLLRGNSPRRLHLPSTETSSSNQVQQNPFYVVSFCSELMKKSFQDGTNFADGSSSENGNLFLISKDQHQTQQPSASKQNVNCQENVVLPETTKQPFVVPDFTFDFLTRNTLFVFAHLTYHSMHILLIAIIER